MIRALILLGLYSTCVLALTPRQSKPRTIKKSLFSVKGFEVGPVIPGLNEHYVPQGMAYDAATNTLCISLYSAKKSPSVLVHVDVNTKKLLAVQKLKVSRSKSLYGHAGGVGISQDQIFVASGGKVYSYPKSLKSQTLVPERVIEAETKASFCTYNENTLFVGEFVYGSKYKSDKSHHVKCRKGLKKYAIICGYDEQQKEPVFALSIRQKVQGLAVTKDKVYLSVSYGRGNSSSVAAYKNPLSEKPHGEITLSSGKTVPLYYIDGVNHTETLTFPPMSEGIAVVDDQLAILTESGAKKYQSGGKGPVDHVIYYDLSVWE